MSRWIRSSLVAFGVLLVPLAAQAAEPNKLQCIAANDAAQDLRRAEKLRESREKLLVCVSASCPGLVRDDCAQRLAEIDRVMPSVVFEAKDAAGSDLVAVAVTMDGERLTDKLDGRSWPVDPGEHRFVFEAAGLPTVEHTIVVHEGERGRAERVVFAQPAALGPLAPSPYEHSAQRTIAIALGGAGAGGLAIGIVLGFVAKSTYDHALNAECGGNANGGCSPQGMADGKAARSQAAASTVAFIAGGALLGAGAVIYFTAPKASVRVGTTVGAERAGIVMAGAW